MSRLAIIGLDCADPKLIGEFLPDTSTLRELAGGHSPACLRSVDPPITVPAWMCAFSGRDPGELGVYGFRNRTDRSYNGLRLASSASFAPPTVWDTLGARGLRSLLIGIPGTYPPRPVQGAMLAGFPMPPDCVDYAYPEELARRVHRWEGPYQADVPNFRTEDKKRLLEQVYAMTQQRFTLTRRLAATQKWDFLAMVDMGPDRLHHALWAHHDPTHPQHNPDSPFRDALHDYYVFLDRMLEELLSDLPGNTQLMIISDHGAQAMHGGIALNDWLIESGYLVLKDRPTEPTRISQMIEADLVDWSHTLAWGEGGYYGRVFLNVVDREKFGTISPARYTAVRDELIHGLEGIQDPHGRPLGTRAHAPEELYRTVTGLPPDLLVYFGDLRWRSIGTVGWDTLHVMENDTGPDDANHAPNGVLLASPETDGITSLLDIHPWILTYFGIEER